MEIFENNNKFLVELDRMYDVSKLDYVHIEILINSQPQWKWQI
jgi:hypothetical protein